MRRLPLLTIAILSLLLVTGVFGADWPQFRYDAGRTAASPEELPAELHLTWSRQLPAPQPAFPLEVRLRFDRSYEPVVLEGTMFVPSMVTDSVTALDTQTGEERWRFFAQAPVRFAPVAWQGKVYFVADDGYLYCLSAADGSLRWKFRGLPEQMNDRKILGHGRLISLWPARGGPVLADGVIYFAAGLWPGYGVFIYALDAESGEVAWANADSNHIPKANMDHGIANYAGLTPQGYLAVVGGKLVVPCGAQLPAFLDLKTGKLDTYCMGWGGRNGLPKGSWFVAGTGKYLSHSGDLYDITRPNDERFRDARGRNDFKRMLYPGAFTRLRIDPTNQKGLGVFGQPVLTPEAMYESDRGIVAYDLTSVKLQERNLAEVPEHRREDTYPDRLAGNFRQLWKLPSQRDVHIKAGRYLYTGGPGIVEAIDTAADHGPAKVAWHASIEGTPHRMLAAAGKLFVVTREGRIYAFSGRKSEDVFTHRMTATSAPPADEWTEKAARILQTTNVTDGYALVLGIDTGRLVEELARQSNLQVIAVDQDAARVAALRAKLHQAGLYGTRVTALVGDPLTCPLPPYLANLVVSENPSALGSAAKGILAEAVFHSLRPFGGTACLAASSAAVDAFEQASAGDRFHGASVRRAGDWILLTRSGPLRGSADWSHEEADAANTGACADRFIRPPFALFWFDASHRWRKPPDSTTVRVAGGRVLVLADRLHAIDVYTGRQLWEAALPFPKRPTNQLVALDDAIYVTGGTTCVVLDPATGREVRRIELPGELSAAWVNLRVNEDYLVGQSGRYVVCLSRPRGQMLWKYRCGRPNLSLALGGGKVFCAELAERVDNRRGPAEDPDAKTRALDAKTGQLLWEVAGGSAVRYSPSLDLVVTSAGVYRADDGHRIAPLPSDVQLPPNTPPANIPRPLFLIGPKLLWGTVESFTVFDLPSGEPSGDRMSWVRRGCTGVRASTHLVTTRFRANAACIDLASRQITPFWNIRPACNNNLFPADGVLNAPSLTGGCTCNYSPVSQAYVPRSAIARVRAERAGN